MSLIYKQTGSIISFDDTEIYYEIRGEGEPLVFCYGIGCLFNHWIHQVKYFSKEYKTILVDYRAHNKSEVPLNYQNISIEAIAKDIQLLLENLKLEKAHFVGHSFGAQVLVKTFDLYPEIFKSMTFINGFVKNPIHGMFGSDLPKKTFELLKTGNEYLPETVGFLWKNLINNPLAGAASALAGGFNLTLTSFKDIEIYTKAISEMDLRAFLILFEDMMNFDGTSILSKINVPCLIISGKKDNITPPEHQEDLHQKIKNSELCVMAYGSHCTQLDLPEYVNLRMESFLKKLRP